MNLHDKLVCLFPTGHSSLVQFLRVRPGAFTRVRHSGNTKGGSITVLLTSCLTGLELAE
jgi:hypothetical protein